MMIVIYTALNQTICNAKSQLLMERDQATKRERSRRKTMK